MSEFIRCDEGGVVLSANGNNLRCNVLNSSGEFFTEAQIIELYALPPEELVMEADFYSFLAYTFCFFALMLGFQSGKTR